MFFPDPKDEKELPISPLLIFNATWPAEECPLPNVEKHNKFCDEIVSLLQNHSLPSVLHKDYLVCQVYNNIVAQ